MSGIANVKVIQFDKDGNVLGEFKECPDCRIKNDEVAGLQRDIRGWTARYAELHRDKEFEAKQHPLWEKATEVFAHWRTACNHKRSKFSTERFELVLPYLEKHGDDLCRRAIDGAAFDPFETRRKNGTTKRHDDWELIFRSSSKFEEFCNRAPLGEEQSGGGEAKEEVTGTAESPTERIST